jgi:hypothetical protein
MSTTRATKAPPSMHFNGFKAAAMIAECLSFATTYALISALLDDMARILIVSIAVESLLLAGKAQLIIKHRLTIISVSAIVIDTIVDAGGIWSRIARIPATDAWRMFETRFHTGHVMSPDMLFWLPITTGFLLAVGIILLWRS